MSNISHRYLFKNILQEVSWCRLIYETGKYLNFMFGYFADWKKIVWIFCRLLKYFFGCCID